MFSLSVTTIAGCRLELVILLLGICICQTRQLPGQNSMESYISYDRPDEAKYGLATEYGHLKEKIFKRLYLRRKPLKGKRRKSKLKEVGKVDSLPAQIDWREVGVIPYVKNQGRCGACWALSVLDTIEARWRIEQNTTASAELSVQQMIDCSKNNDCSGGDPLLLVKWISEKEVELFPRSLYPENELYMKRSCLTDDHSEKWNIKGIKLSKYNADDLSRNENQLLQYLTQGPVVASINAISWQFYLGGIIQYHCDNAPRLANHVVQIVGYNRNATIPYYIVKNSWGTTFGEEGYVRIAIGKNVCGIANQILSLDISKE